MKWLLRLRHRIAALILLTMLPMAAYVVYAAYDDHRRAMTHIDEDARRAARAIADTQMRLFASAKLLLELLAQTQPIRAMDAGACNDMLTRIIGEQPHYAGIALFTPQGDRLCGGTVSNRPVNVADRPYFRRALESRGFAVGDFHVGRVSGKPSLGFALPKYGPDGALQSVLYAGLDLGWLAGMLDRTTLPPGSELVMMDRRGTVLARAPDPGGTVGQYQGESHLFGAIRAKPAETSAELPGLDGEVRLYHLFPFQPTSDAIGGYLALGLPIHEWTQAIEAGLYRRIALLATMAVILMIVAHWIGHRLITRPIRRLVGLSRAIGAGDLAARSGLDARSGELGALGAAMDDMADRLAKSDAAQREGRAMLRAVIDAVPATINVKGRDGRYILANAALADFHGTSVDDFAGKTPADFYPESYVRRVRDRDARILATGQGTGLYETDYPDLDGGTSTWLACTVPLVDDEGAVSHVVSVAFDITDRKRAEEALRDSRALLRAVIDAVPSCINVKDADGRYMLMNDFEARYHGRDVDWCIGRAVEDFYPAAVAERMRDLDRRIIESGAPAALFEAVFESRDGRTQTWLTTKAPLRDEGGRMTCVVTVDIDITERKAAEQRLRDSERRLRHLVESANVVPYEWDVAARRYSYVGPQIARLLGTGPELWTDEDFWLTQVHPDDRARLQAHSAEFNAAPRDERQEYRFVRADGGIVWVQDIVTVETDEQGRMIGYGIIVDISEAKQRDQQLLQAQKMEAVGQLTSGIAHDFNNLLAVSIGNLDLLLPRLADPGARSLADGALTANLRGADLVKRLLAFSRRQLIQAEAVDLNRLVSQATELLRRAMGPAFEIDTSLAADLWPLRSDPAQLDSALTNLVINARDAMPQGGRIAIETLNERIDAAASAEHPGLEPGDYVTLAVSDDGCGIPSDILDRIFEPFFTTKPAGRGSGLGLSMVYGFVRQSGGQVEIDSAWGRGTSVRLYLPRAQAGGAAAPSRADEAPVPEIGGRLVLVVDDDATVRQTAVAHLAALGCRTIEAVDAGEALAALEREPAIDVVFSDVLMPGMNGWQLADAVRRARPDVRILLTSGFAGPAVQTLDGGDTVPLLGKPYRRHDLARRLFDLFMEDAA